MTWGIRHKVLGLVVLSAVLPTALVGSMSYWTARSTLTAKVSDQLNTQASLTAAKVSEWFQERERDAQIFADSAIVTSNLERGRSGATSRARLISAYLEEVIARYDLYRTLVVIDESGNMVASAGPIANEEVSRISNRAIERRVELEWTGEAPQPSRARERSGGRAVTSRQHRKFAVGHHDRHRPFQVLQ